jgi:hypothetical protein
LKTLSCSFHDVTSAFKNGTDDASGSGSGVMSLAKTLPPCWMTLRSVASPMPDEAPDAHEWVVVEMWPWYLTSDDSYLAIQAIKLAI